MKRGWMALVALVLVSSAVPLTQVMMDRSAPPRMTLQLTQREFYRAWREDDNTGEALTWVWRTAPEIDSVAPRQLEAMGIHCRATTYDCGLRSGRSGWMVVAVDTVAWQRGIDSVQWRIDSIRAVPSPDTLTLRALREREAQLEQVTWYTSRLVMVDAGRDADALLARWSDGAHLMLRARLTVYRDNWPRDTVAGEPLRYRVHAEPEPQMLYIPNAWAPVIRDSTVRGSYDRQARYHVVVGVGRGWLPRVLEVTR